MDIDGVYLFKSESGIPLYSRKNVDVEEDLFSAFLSALKGFFNSFALGGLSTFASDDYIFYLASANNVLTSLIVDNRRKSDKYFNLAYEISIQYYKKFKNTVDSDTSISSPPKEEFDPILDQIIEKFEKTPEEQDELIKLYKINSDGGLEQFDFFTERELYDLAVFVAVNFVTKHIFIIENAEEDVPSRILFFANKAVSNMNQREFKSEFIIRNVSDPYALEMVVDQISKLLRGESIKI